MGGMAGAANHFSGGAQRQGGGLETGICSGGICNAYRMGAFVGRVGGIGSYITGGMTVEAQGVFSIGDA